MDNKATLIGEQFSSGGLERLKHRNSNKNLHDLEKVINYFPTAAIVIDVTGKPVNYNQAATELLGVISEGIKPEDWSKQFGLFMQDGKTYFPFDELTFTHVMRGETVGSQKLIHNKNHNTEPGWLSISANPIATKDGKIDGAIVFFNDVTIQKRIKVPQGSQINRTKASFALSQQISRSGMNPNEILKTVVMFSSEKIGDGCVAACMPTDNLNIVSYHHKKLASETILNQVVLSHGYGFDGSIEQVILTGEPILNPIVDQAQLRQIAKPDQLRYMEEVGVQSLLVVPIKGRNGVIGTISLFRDWGSIPYTIDDQIFMMDIAYRTGLAIDNKSLAHSLHMETSGRRIAEEALDFSEARFQSIFTSTTLAIKLLDLKGIILETNPAFQQMLGYSSNELIGMPITDFWHPADKNNFLHLFNDLKNERIRNFQLEHRLLNKSGATVWVNVAFSGIKKNEADEELAFIVAIAENITERKNIEIEINEMKNRLNSHVEMERLRLAQELHDGPLQELYSAIYKIEGWGNRSKEVDQENFSSLKTDLLNIVNSLRNTAKDLRPPALAKFGLEKAIRSHAEEFKANHPEMTIRLNLAQDKLALPEDIRLTLFRVYQHSLSNVLRHAHADRVEIYFAFDAEVAELEICDNGIGFEVPSSWVELVRAGHYGLAGAVERVSLLDGSYTVESQHGMGTTARVAIPIQECLAPDLVGKSGLQS
jgi:PAS domain S-box-containing protein